MSSGFMLAGLKEARERLGMSQEQAARACSTSASAYQRWERGAANPPAAKAEEVSEALGCTLDQLVHGFDAPRAEPSRAITRKEFDELREKVDRLLEHAGGRRPSLYCNAAEIAKRLGLADSHGRPVAAGCLIKTPSCSRPRKVAAIEIADYKGAPDMGLASVTCVMEDGDRLHAVDMRVKGEVLGRAGR